MIKVIATTKTLHLLTERQIEEAAMVRGDCLMAGGVCPCAFFYECRYYMENKSSCRTNTTDKETS